MTKPDQALSSRRKVITACVAGVAMAATASTARAQAKKAAQKVVQYVEVSKRPNSNCGNCVNFLPPNACKVVDGEIVPTGWCLVWALKKPSG